MVKVASVQVNVWVKQKSSCKTAEFEAYRLDSSDRALSLKGIATDIEFD